MSLKTVNPMKTSQQGMSEEDLLAKGKLNSYSLFLCA